VGGVTSVPVLLAINLVVTMGAMVGLWGLSIRLGDPSFVDAWWPIGFVVVAWVSFALGDGDPTRSAVLAALTTIWGLRLGGYLFWRWRRNGPDGRYVAMLRHATGNPHVFTLTRVFLLQGALLWVVSLSLQLGQVGIEGTPAGLRPAGLVGLVLAIVGILLESIGDLQLVRFKADPANEGKVMDRGLWRYTRHPNYFGDACLWWGLFLVALANPVTAVGIVGPLVMTSLLARWSGVGPLERRLERHKPGYADYIARTSGFVPMPPHRARPTTIERRTS
jgi:steroid 5-alpha reductase family enzyme